MLSVGGSGLRLFVLQVVIIVLLVAAAVAALVLQARGSGLGEGRRQTPPVVHAFVNAPGAAQTLDDWLPTCALQPYAGMAWKKSGAASILVMDASGIRNARPDPAWVGEKYGGDIQPAPTGCPIVEYGQGPVRPGWEGTSVQARVPVTLANRSIAGVMPAGLGVQRESGLLVHQLPIILGVGAAALVLAATGIALVTSRERKQTHRKGLAEMARMYEHHEAALRAVREGALVIGADGLLLLANEEAQRLLCLPADAEQRHVGELELDGG